MVRYALVKHPSKIHELHESFPTFFSFLLYTYKFSLLLLQYIFFGLEKLLALLLHYFYYFMIFLCSNCLVCVCCLLYFILVNPIASSHFQNAQQQNLTQNYSLHPNTNPMQVNHYDAASFNPNNNFNNFEQSNQFQYQQTQQNFSQAGGLMQQQNQQNMYQQNQQNIQQQNYYGQSIVQQNMNNGPSTYQHTINDLLVHQPTTNYQQTNIYNSQDPVPVIQTHQSVSC